MSGGFDFASFLSGTNPVPASNATSSASAPHPGAPVAKGADALLQAVIHGGDNAPHKPEAQGVILGAGSDTFDIDTKAADQLQVAPITVVKTDYREQVLHQIASNSTYICYGLKAGQIRVLNKQTAKRTLLKGHTCMVVDMKFFSSSSNVLASCDQSGEVFVRRVYEDNPTDEKAPILEDVLVRHKFAVGTKATKRLAWHPQLENLLALALDDRVVLINVPPSSGVAASAPEFSAPTVPAGPMTSGSITCAAFSDRGDLLAVSDDLGRVYVWALPPDLESAQTFEPLPVTPDLVFDAFPGEPAMCVEFLPSSTPHGILVVGDATARRLSLWVVDGCSADPAAPAFLQPPLSAACTYRLELTSSSGGPAAFFNHLLVQPNFSVVVLANTKKQQVYVLHAHQDQATGAASFDYASVFRVKMPILSMTTMTEDAAGADVFKLYCVQTEAIQEYLLYPTSCFPSADLEEEVARQAQLQAEAAPPADGITPVLPPTVHTPTVSTTSSPDLITPPLTHTAHPAVAAPDQAAADGGAAAGAVNSIENGAEAAPAAAAAPPAPHVLPAPFGLRGDPAALLPQSTSSLLDDVVALAAGMKLSQDRSQQPRVPVEAVPDASTVTQIGGLAHRVSVGSEAGSTTSDAASPALNLATTRDDAAVPEKAARQASGGPPAPTDHVSTPHSSHAPSEPASVSSQHTQHAAHAHAAAAAASKQAAKQLKSGPSAAAAAAPAPPPQPSLLLKKMGSATASSLPPAPSPPVPEPSAAAAPALQPSSAHPTATAGTQGGAAEAEQAAVPVAAAAPSTEVLTALASQVAAGNKELLRVIKAEIKAEAKAQAKASEAALAKAVDTLRGELKAAEKREREEVSRVVGAAVSTLTKELGTKLSEGLKALPAQVAAATKAAVADALPAATSQAVSQAVDKAVAAQLRATLPTALSAAFTSSVLPAFERATAAMFGQIQDTFASGLSGHLATASGASQAVAASLQESAKQMGTLVGSLRTEMEGLRASSAGGAAGGESRPAPRDPRLVCTDHLRAKQYEAAFEAALSADNQDVLVWLLKQLQPNTLLSESPCPLSQGVMLSLMSHLAHAMGKDTTLRLQWMTEVATCVDPHDEHTGPYLRAVLEPIKDVLTDLAQNGVPWVQRDARMTVHVINSLLHQ